MEVIEQAQTLRERIDDLMTKCQFAGMSRRATADSILSLILSEIDKAGLTDEQLYHLEQDYGWGKDTEERGFILSVADIAAAAQLEAIKKQLRGEGNDKDTRN